MFTGSSNRRDITERPSESKPSSKKVEHLVHVFIVSQVLLYFLEFSEQVLSRLIWLLSQCICYTEFAKARRHSDSQFILSFLPELSVVPRSLFSWYCVGVCVGVVPQSSSVHVGVLVTHGKIWISSCVWLGTSHSVHTLSLLNASTHTQTHLHRQIVNSKKLSNAFTLRIQDHVWYQISHNNTLWNLKLPSNISYPTSFPIWQ